jgi:putative nucleotidyltransferase with HDIG domain
MNAQTLVDSVRTLAAPSESVRRLLELLQKPDTEPDEVIDAIKLDGVMSVKLLAVCNSAALGVSEPINSIEHAVFHLGQNRIYQLAVALGFGDKLAPQLSAYAIADRELWSHSLLTALLMPAVLDSVSALHLPSAVAYTAGLVHDIGKVVLNQVLDQDKKSAIQNLVAAGTHSLCEAEASVVEVDHAAVGACLLEKWRLPETIVEAVAHHHRPVTRPEAQLSAAVYLANVVAHEVGPSTGWGSLSIRADDTAAEDLGLSAGAADALVVKALQAMAQVQQIQAAA